MTNEIQKQIGHCVEQFPAALFVAYEGDENGGSTPLFANGDGKMVMPLLAAACVSFAEMEKMSVSDYLKGIAKFAETMQKTPQDA